MSGHGKGVCPSCRQPRQVTVRGFVRLHNTPGGTAKCPGSGQEPAAAGTPAAPRPKVAPPPGTRLMLPAPTEPTWGRSCDGGGCDAESVGWRLFRDLREWLPVCGIHMGTAPERARVYDRALESVAAPATQASEPVDFVTETFGDGSQRTRLDRLTDGRVMCCLCFEYTPRDGLELAQDGSGDLTDVCKPCAAKERR